MSSEEEEGTFEFYMAKVARDAAVAEVRAKYKEEYSEEEGDIKSSISQGMKRKIALEAKAAGDQAYIQSLEDAVVTCEMEKECSKAILESLIRDRKRDEAAMEEKEKQKLLMERSENGLLNSGNTSVDGNANSNSNTSNSEGSFRIFGFGDANGITSSPINRNGSNDFLAIDPMEFSFN